MESKKNEVGPNASNDFSITLAMQDTEKTKSALQHLLKGVSEGKGLYQRKKDEKSGIVPQLFKNSILNFKLTHL